MEKLFASIDEKIKFFAENAAAQVKNGNKAAGMRARKASLELEKLLKEFRKVSVEAAK
ncbi:MAG: histone H1 [Paludibacteraceae bacterium]|nr:histone H1 [Paludibacteraceae bacterium]